MGLAASTPAQGQRPLKLAAPLSREVRAWAQTDRLQARALVVPLLPG